MDSNLATITAAVRPRANLFQHSRATELLSESAPKSSPKRARHLANRRQSLPGREVAAPQIAPQRSDSFRTRHFRIRWLRQRAIGLENRQLVRAREFESPLPVLVPSF